LYIYNIKVLEKVDFYNINYFRFRFLIITFGGRYLDVLGDFNSSIAAKPAIIGSAIYIQRRMLLANFSIKASINRTITQMIEFLCVEFILTPP
jgi:hypothetical protein